MKRKNYKKAFDVLMNNKALWRDLTNEENINIFQTLNKEANFNFQ